MENELILSIQQSFKLYKEPHKIGDIIEYKDTSYLIIGVEHARFVGANLVVIFTCQNLSLSHGYPTRDMLPVAANQSEFSIEIDTKAHLEKYPWERKGRGNLLPLGKVFHCEGNYYRWLTYTNIAFDFTTLQLYGLAETVYATTPKKAKRVLLDHKKSKLGLSLIRSD